MDIDISMKDDINSLKFSREELKRLEQNISNYLATENLSLIDFKLVDSPKSPIKSFGRL